MMAFLLDISDLLYELRNHPVRYTENLDGYPASLAHLCGWIRLMDFDLMNNLGRGYEDNASGLLRVIRKESHFPELPSYILRLLGPLPAEDKSSMGMSAKVPQCCKCRRRCLHCRCSRPRRRSHLHFGRMRASRSRPSRH